MRKKLISLLLSLSICLSFMSMAVFADETVYNVWVNGDRFTSNCLTIQCGDGTAKFNPQTNELTLTNATITKDYFAAGIYCNKEDLTVILVGNNSIKTVFYGINLYRKSLTITGKGNLSIEDGIGNGLLIDTNDVGEDITIDIEGTLSIKSNDNCIQTPKTVNILGNGKIELESTNYGIYNHDDVLISGKNEISISCDESGIRTIGKISVSGENKITINAKDIGMSAESGIDFTNSGSITIDANTGLYSDNGSVKQSGKGSLTITSKTEGIRVRNDITLEGDSQTIDINSENFGLWSDEGNITFSGNGNIDIKSTNPAIFSNCGNFSILGSDLVWIESEQNAVLAKGAKISHDGLVEISSNRGIEIYDNGITFSGLGETNIYSTYSCINLNNGSKIVFGEDSQYISGNIEISSTNGNAITFASEDCTAEINGNAHNISLNSAPGYKVISDSNNKKEYSIDVKNPEVYDITGSSTESSAQYKLKFYFITFDMNGHEHQ
ncbi:MAG: carbohydrate-binding domain-containing protein [Clostridia bacterium]|nr:carbohydrate-binding domain-containing protein [Clostridia bacterium]